MFQEHRQWLSNVTLKASIPQEEPIRCGGLNTLPRGTLDYNSWPRSTNDLSALIRIEFIGLSPSHWAWISGDRIQEMVFTGSSIDCGAHVSWIISRLGNEVWARAEDGLYEAEIGLHVHGKNSRSFDLHINGKLLNGAFVSVLLRAWDNNLSSIHLLSITSPLIYYLSIYLIYTNWHIMSLFTIYPFAIYFSSIVLMIYISSTNFSHA